MRGEYAAHAVTVLTVTLRSLLLLLGNRAFIQVMCNADMQLTTHHFILNVGGVVLSGRLIPTM